MIRPLILLLGLSIAVLIASPSVRGWLRQNPVSTLIYGGTAVAVVLVIAGRVHWLVAAGWGVMALGRRLIPGLGALVRYWRRDHRRRSEEAAHAPNEGAESSEKPRAKHMSATQARETLGVSPDAEADEIAQAHRRLMQRLHPDRGGSADLARRVNEAREVLMAASRERHDSGTG